MKWSGHLARLGENRNERKLYSEKSESLVKTDGRTTLILI
jgi:hypothetical protein